MTEKINENLFGFEPQICGELVRTEHGKIAELIWKECERQQNTVELIASENFPSTAVKAAAGSCFVAKYAEGYPNIERTGNRGRYYGGCTYADEMEAYCCDKWREVFHTDYHVNVQPHSGSSANMAAYQAVLKPGGTILSMSLQNGGHLSHGSPVNFSGRFYDIHAYGVDEQGFIDYADFRAKFTEIRPDLVVVGASAYSRTIDFQRVRAIMDECLQNNTGDEWHPLLMVDMAHIAGLIAAGDHPTPFGIADIITTTTHKTLRGTRGGIIFCKPELAKKIDSAVFPGCQGGPLLNIIAAKAVTAEEACTDEYKEYIHQVVANTKAMCDRFIELGYDVVTGGTDNHLFLIDFSKTHPNLTGKMVEEELGRYDIAVNKNCVPNEKRKPSEASGIRIGCAAMTTKGYGKDDFIHVADLIDQIITNMEA